MCEGCYALGCYGNHECWSPREEMNMLYQLGLKTKFLSLLQGRKNIKMAVGRMLPAGLRQHEECDRQSW